LMLVIVTADEGSDSFETINWHSYQGSKTNRWKFIHENIVSSPVANTLPNVILDWGSNEGFFSIHLARLFPKFVVFSVEMDNYLIKLHHSHIQETTTLNNIICEGKVDRKKLDTFIKSNINVGIQLLLSIVHWWDITRTLEDFIYYMEKLFSKSVITIVELPLPENDTAYVAKWYYNYTEESILKKIVNNMPNADIKLIGYERSTHSRDAQNRKIFLITNYNIQNYKYKLSYSECNQFISTIVDDDFESTFCYKREEKPPLYLPLQWTFIIIFSNILVGIIYLYYKLKNTKAKNTGQDFI